MTGRSNRRLAAVLLVAVSLCAAGAAARELQQQAAAAPAPKAPAAAAPSKPAAAPKGGAKKADDDGPTQLHIVHINDVHNRIEETSATSASCVAPANLTGTCLGGWARISTIVNEARKNATDAGAGFMFLDAGDQFDGSLWDVVYRGAATAVIQNLQPPDAMQLGNHEFSFPAERLASYIRNVSFPILGACNIDVSKEPLLQGKLIRRYATKQIGKYKVGIIGWITPETAFTAANVGKVTFKEPSEAVRRCVDELKREHPDVHYIIGLSHEGYEDDLDMAYKVPDLDIIIGGHSHTFLNSPDSEGGPIFDKTKSNVTRKNCADKFACDEPAGPFPTVVKTKQCAPNKATGGRVVCGTKNVPVVQAFYASKYAGALEIDLPSKTLKESRVILLGGPNSTNPVAMDPVIVKAIDHLSPPVASLMNKAAGKIDVALKGGKGGRVKETNFGDYMADLMVSTVKKLPELQKKDGPCTIGLINAGALRADIDPPTVTYGEILTAIPFLNTLAVKSLSGKELINTVEFGLSGIDEAEGRFLQVSGLRIWHKGANLLALHLLKPDGTSPDPVSRDGKYPVATLDFLAAGGDGFADLKKGATLLAQGDRIDELLFESMVDAMPNAIKIPDPDKERRIINCEASYVDCSNLPLYGPCCTEAARAASRKPADLPNENVKDDENVKRRRARLA